jgi:hypothetical protein
MFETPDLSNENEKNKKGFLKIDVVNCRSEKDTFNVFSHMEKVEEREF